MSNLDGFVGKGEEPDKESMEGFMKEYGITAEEMEERPIVILREGEEITGSVVRMREVRTKFGPRMALDMDTPEGPRTMIVVHKVLAKKILQLKLRGALEGRVMRIKNAGKTGKAYSYEVDVLDQSEKAEADEFIRRDP
ncbi:MAG: hypothetical protein ACP5RJ_09000 [Conexivisphaera sp.]